jgi:hypothetical protein
MLLQVGARGAPHHLKRDQPPWDLHFLGDGVNPPLQKALGSSGDCASGTLALTMRREHERIGRCVRTYLPPSLNDRYNVVGNRHGVSARSCLDLSTIQLSFIGAVLWIIRLSPPYDFHWRPNVSNEMERDANELRRNKRSGKIVLPCRPKFLRKGKSFFQAHFAADSIFGQVIPWTPI